MDLHACLNIQIRVSFRLVQFSSVQFGLVAILSVARAKDEVISYPTKSSPEIWQSQQCQAAKKKGSWSVASVFERKFIKKSSSVCVRRVSSTAKRAQSGWYPSDRASWEWVGRMRGSVN